MYLQRSHYLKKIEPFIDKEIIKILTGVRRCGKSVLLSQVKASLRERGVPEERLISMNFDTFETGENLDAAEIYQMVKAKSVEFGGKLYVFFDEVHELSGWEKLVNSCATELGCDMYITGSNSKMLSKEYASLLTGRYITFTIFPFSFAEALSLRLLQGKELPAQEVFADYLVFGGMPFIYQLDDRHSRLQYLRDVAEAIISKDITERYNIRDVDLLKRTIVFLLSNIGSLFSANSVANFFRAQGRSVSWETISNYVEHVKTACLFLSAIQSEITGKEILRAPEKLYLSDHGFREALYGKNQINASQVLENMVYLELIRNDYQVTIGKVGKQEIDFVATKDNRTVYLQVCYLLANEEIAEREFRPLKEIRDNFPKLVLSLDSLDLSRDGILHLNVIDFLADSRTAMI